MDLPVEPLDVAIVGGGIAGLTVAYHLSQDAPWLRFALFEACNLLGGKVLTERVQTDAGEFIVESGPDAYLAQKPWARNLAVKLGLENDIVPINHLPNPVMIMKHGRLHRIPEGVRLIAPTRLVPFATSKLFDPMTRLRILGELIVPRGAEHADESLGSFVRRRFGNGALDWLAEPLVAGIYNADPDRLSLAATFPHLLAMERNHGSIIRGLRAAVAPAQHPAKPLFETFRRGTASLIEALEGEIGRYCQTNSAVTKVNRVTGDVYRLEFGNREPVNAKKVILALPAHPAASLLAPLDSHVSNHLNALRTVSAGTLTLAFRNQEIPRPLHGYGMLFPAKTRPVFNALTVSSSKFPGRAPVGWTLLRLFFGGYRTPATMQLNDSELLGASANLLMDLMGIRTSPCFFRIQRWPGGSPQYDVGHLDRVRAIRAALPAGIDVVGSPYDGVGLPDIVRSATLIADDVIADISIVAQSNPVHSTGEVFATTH